MATPEDLVVAHKAQNPGEAEIVRALLEAAGVSAMVSEKHSPLPSIDLTPMDGEYNPTSCEVLVARKDLEEAKRIIQEARQTAAEDLESEEGADEASEGNG